MDVSDVLWSVGRGDDAGGAETYFHTDSGVGGWFGSLLSCKNSLQSMPRKRLYHYFEQDLVDCFLHFSNPSML